MDAEDSSNQKRDFWDLNVEDMKSHLKTKTNPLVLKRNWSRIRAPPHMFHLMYPIFKAWHSCGHYGSRGASIFMKKK